MEQLAEVVDFLHPSNQPYVQAEALNILAPFIAENDYHSFLIQSGLVSKLAPLVVLEDMGLAHEALKGLVNLSTSQIGRMELIDRDMPIRIMEQCKEMSAQEGLVKERIELSAMILSNLTLEEIGRQQLLEYYEGSATILRLLEWFLRPPFVLSEEKESLESWTAGWDHFGMVLVNLSQEPVTRDIILDDQRIILEDLMNSLKNGETFRRIHILRIVRNCAFDVDKHDILLHYLDILLSPIIGADLIDLEEYNEFPKQIRDVWNVEKEREESVEIRRLVIELLEVFVRNQDTRTILRDWNIYLILREYDTWESDSSLNEEVYELVQWFIVDEEEELADAQSEVKMIEPQVDNIQGD